MDDLDETLDALWRPHQRAPASPDALQSLRAQGMPEALVRLYARGDGGGADGIVLLRASQVRRGHDDVDDDSVRGQLVFAENGKSFAAREIFTVDVNDFFGLGAGAIYRGKVTLKWGWAQHVAPDAATLLVAMRKGKLRATSVAKRARAALAKAVATSASARVAPGEMADEYQRKHRDPDRCSYNLRHDGKTKIPWAISHLYYVIGGLTSDDGLVVRPFVEIDRAPPAWADLAGGFVFATRGETTYVVSRASMNLPEGLVLAVERDDPGSALVLGHLLDVVTGWVGGEAPRGVPVAQWRTTFGR